jgi:nicotinamidase-related amidase
MTISMLDTKAALLVVDLQKGIVGMPVAHPIADVVNNSARLAAAFRRHALPVVLINVDSGAPGRTEQSPRIREFPAGWTDLVPELEQQPSDHLVTKRTWGAFTNTDLEKYLKQSGATQVVVVGVATSAGVESTARHAHELGFNVALAVDAMTDLNADAHHNSITRIFPRMAETGTTQEIIDLLDARSRGENRSA